MRRAGRAPHALAQPYRKTILTNQPFGSAGAFWALALVWLPAGIVAVSLARGVAPPITPETVAMLPEALRSLAVTAPFGLPLALAFRAIRRTGSTRAAWTTFAILAPLTSLGALVAGLLGPIAIAVCAAVLSAPAWIVYAVVRRNPRS